jgi:leucine dehydrogenase
VDEKLDRLALTLEEVLEQALRERRPTHEVANEIAKARIVGAPRKQAAA